MNTKQTRINSIVLGVILLLIFNTDHFGQSKVATTIGQFLKIDPSAKVSSLAGAGTSLYSEASSVYYNPASLGMIEDFSVQFTNTQWLADIDFNYAIAVVPVESVGSFSLHFLSLNSGEMLVRTVENPHGTGERFSVNNIALGLGYGLSLTEKVAVGFLVNFIQESIWNSSISTFGINIGVQYRVSENSLTIGASVSNFGPKAQYDGRDLFVDYDFDADKYGDNDGLPAELRTDEFTLPTLFRVGVSYPIIISNSNKIIMTVDALHPNDNNESIRAGLDWQLTNNFNVRAGYRDLFMEDSEGGLTLGAGINVKLMDYKFLFDYAWADYGRLENVHRFSLGIGL